MEPSVAAYICNKGMFQSQNVIIPIKIVKCCNQVVLFFFKASLLIVVHKFVKVVHHYIILSSEICTILYFILSARHGKIKTENVWGKMAQRKENNPFINSIHCLFC